MSYNIRLVHDFIYIYRWLSINDILHTLHRACARIAEHEI